MAFRCLRSLRSLILIYTKRRRTWYRWICDDKSSYLLNIKIFLSCSLRFVILDILECINIQLTRAIPMCWTTSHVTKLFFFNNEFNCATEWERVRSAKPSELVVIIKVDFMRYPRTFISFGWCLSDPDFEWVGILIYVDSHDFFFFFFRSVSLPVCAAFYTFRHEKSRFLFFSMTN